MKLNDKNMSPFKLILCAGAIALASCTGKSASASEIASSADSAAGATIEKVSDAPAVTVIKAGQQIPPAKGKLIVIDFNATWCGPCRRFAPTFDAVAKKYRSQASFYSVDVDQNPRLAAMYNVQSVPTVIYITPDGSVYGTQGLLPQAEFDARVASLLK